MLEREIMDSVKIITKFKEKHRKYIKVSALVSWII